MKKQIITITGNLGAGKSTTGKAVASLLSYTHKSTGDFMRILAQERGVTLNELSIAAETDPSIDEILDNSNKELVSMENIVVDGRLAWFFIPESFKVFLKLKPEIAAERILKDTENKNRQNESGNFHTKDSILNAINFRLESERKRYKDLYDINDHQDETNYDCVIDTGLPENNIERVPQIIIEEYNKWLQK